MCSNQADVPDAKTYSRVAEAIEYISRNFKKQPSLDEIADAAGLSPFHFQRVFSEWAGVSPKKFVQYLTLEHAKRTLRDGRASLLDAAYASGLSGPGRLHDLFVRIESMTPGEFKGGGANLQINYSFEESLFGRVLVASTPSGVCHMAFGGEDDAVVEDLYSRFPNATYRNSADQFQQDALRIFQGDWGKPDGVRLHLKGSVFQIKVWESLLKIPPGKLVAYGDVARSIGQPAASRAVGSAVGRNPVAFLIPCHRVIQSSGSIGDYRWGPTRKSAIIGWEAARASCR